ncbi:hypothetical protein M9H77_05738 [Catharanthus roseus]|uniref:Uncharacterized protein n=1 Tax=Catharanthus roseus TaxID=4058 RepID=A0ACC0CHZ1_CATRO|nr:hypothetical protein M9H77_05738 [Catharanthus roseus]
MDSSQAAEKRTETVEYRSSAGQSQEEKKPVQVIHQPHSHGSDESNMTSGGVLSNAAASIATTLQSAKDAISRK